MEDYTLVLLMTTSMGTEIRPEMINTSLQSGFRIQSLDPFEEYNINMLLSPVLDVTLARPVVELEPCQASLSCLTLFLP